MNHKTLISLNYFRNRLLDRTELTFTGTRVFEAYDDGVQIKDNDVSAVTCIRSGICFIASDETRFLQSFSISGDNIQVGGRLYLKFTEAGNEHKDYDIECLASFEDSIIAIGSHSWKRKKCERQKRGRAVFIGKVDAELIGTRTPMIATKVSLKKAFRRFPILQHFFDSSLQQNGLNIEGITVLHQTVYIGFRAPYFHGRKNAVLIMSVRIEDLLVEQFDAAKLFFVRLSDKPGLGIRGLETLGDQVLILAGNSGVNIADRSDDEEKAAIQEMNGCFQAGLYRGHPFSIYLWSPGSEKARFITDIKPINDKMKAEGLLILNNAEANSDKISLLVFFDNDPGGKPTKFLVDMREKVD